MVVRTDTKCEENFLYSADCTLFDRTLQAIAAVWNASFLGLPSKSNPVFETSNKDNSCSINLQTDKRLWFLVGAVDNKPKFRNIDVPVGLPIFIPIITRDSLLLPDQLKSSADFAKLYEDARSYKERLDKLTLKLEIDNCKFEYDTLSKYYLESVPFKVLIPVDNVYKNSDEPICRELEDKIVIGVSSGIFVPVKPLPLLANPHIISFYAREDGEQEFVIDIKYSINIVANPSKFLGFP